MKNYSGYRTSDDDFVSDNFVFVSENGQDVPLDLNVSLKVRNHSPTGFNWGYGGSGPHQLALGILFDFTGDEYLSETLHHALVKDYVAGWGNKWELSGETLQTWIDTEKAKMN
jgi:hypothetical protein